MLSYLGSIRYLDAALGWMRKRRYCSGSAGPTCVSTTLTVSALRVGSSVDEQLMTTSSLPRLLVFLVCLGAFARRSRASNTCASAASMIYAWGSERRFKCRFWIRRTLPCPGVKYRHKRTRRVCVHAGLCILINVDATYGGRKLGRMKRLICVKMARLGRSTHGHLKHLVGFGK